MTVEERAGHVHFPATMRAAHSRDAVDGEPHEEALFTDAAVSFVLCLAFTWARHT